MSLPSPFRHLLSTGTSAALLCAAMASTPVQAGDAAPAATPAPVVLPEAKVFPSKPAPPALPTDLPRVRVVETDNGFRVVTADGQLLRGGAAWAFKYGRSINILPYSTDPAYYAKLKANGLNAIRLICFDPWQFSGGDNKEYPNGYDHSDWDNQKEVDEHFDHVDKIIDLASQAGLYVMLNYHNTGHYYDRNAKTLNYISKFWAMTAPRYANRTHVFYEAYNEPLQWWPDNYKDEDLANFYAVYKLIRSKAPDTHIAQLSFANVVCFSAPPVTPRDVTHRLETFGPIDWSKSSVAFHPYGNGGTSKTIVDLISEYPAINSEQGLPDNCLQAAEKMDGDYMGVQTMERIGVSWFHWYIAENGKDLEFDKNFTGRVLADAKSKNYLWKTTSAIPPAPTALGGSGRDQAVLLGWKSSANAAGYNIYRGTKADGSDAKQIATYVHTLSYLDKGLQDGKSYVYQVAAVNSLGESPKSATTTAMPEKAAVGTGTGLRGQYFTDKNFTAPAAVTRLDATVDFAFSWAPPVQGVPHQNFSIRWQGELLAPYSGEYTFYVNCKDGVRLWVGDLAGKPGIENWKDGKAADYSFTMTLKGGQKFPIKLDTYNSGSDHSTHLYWSYGGVRKQPIPAAFLYPAQ
jgi:hypothetical protein